MGRDKPDFEISTMRTIGDKSREDWSERVVKLSQEVHGRKWSLEIEDGVATGDFDLAVHSGKDLPFTAYNGTDYLPMLRRENPCDVFIPREPSSTVASLAAGSVIGTNSNRRRANMLSLRPDFSFAEYSGNVTTRIEAAQMEKKGVDGVVMAAAGLIRLQCFDPSFMQVLSIYESLPAASQGILAIQLNRDGDPELREAVKFLQDRSTVLAWHSERGFLEAFDTSCETPIAVYAEILDRYELRTVILRARIPQAGGSSHISFESTHDFSNVDPAEYEAWAVQIGKALAQSAIKAGARKSIAAPSDFVRRPTSR